MKRIRIFLALAFLAAPLLAQTPTSATFTIGYTPSSSWPICTVTVNTQCVSSFTITQAGTVVATIPAVAGVSSYTYTLTTLPSAPGSYTYIETPIGVFGTSNINGPTSTVSLQQPGAPAGASSFTVVVQ